MYRMAGGLMLGKGLLVVCDTHTAAEIGASYIRWLARMGKEFNDEYKDD
jgi:hypothetical protein